MGVDGADGGGWGGWGGWGDGGGWGWMGAVSEVERGAPSVSIATTNMWIQLQSSPIGLWIETYVQTM